MSSDANSQGFGQNLGAVRYRLYSLYRIQVFATLGLFTLVAIGLVVANSLGKGPPPWFTAFWVVALAWNAYWFLFRIIFDVELDGNTLRWRTPVRSGSVNVWDIAALRPQRATGNIEVIELTEGRPLLVMIRQGFPRFADELVMRRPGLPVSFGRLARLSDRWPGPSGFSGST